MSQSPTIEFLVVDFISIGDLKAVFLECGDVDEVLVTSDCDLLQFVVSFVVGVV